MTVIEELTLRVAVLRVRKDQVSAAFNAARAEAEKAYAPHRMRGNRTLTPVLPGGIEAGTVSIKAGAVHVAFDEEALFALIAECEPENIEDWVDPAVLADRRVLDLIREHFPEMVAKRVNPGRRPELAQECIDSDGKLLNTASGERVKVAEIMRADPTGEFAYTPGKKGTAAILAALRDGTVTEDGRAVAAPAGPVPGAGSGD